MPSQRKQFNVRPDDDTWELVRQLRPAVSANLGLAVSLSDLFRLGMLALKEKHLPEPTNGREAAGPRGRRR